MAVENCLFLIGPKTSSYIASSLTFHNYFIKTASIEQRGYSFVQTSSFSLGRQEGIQSRKQAVAKHALA